MQGQGGETALKEWLWVAGKWVRMVPGLARPDIDQLVLCLQPQRW